MRLVSRIAPLLIAFAATLAAVPAPAADVSYASKDLELRATPANDAPVTARLPRNTRFEVVGRQQSWARVSSGTQQGWVLFFYLMPEPGATGSAQNDVKGAAGLLTGRQGSGQVTAVVGIRGLDEEQLKAARFNAEELKLLEAQRSTPQAAEAFAAEGRLAPQSVNYLPAPATAPGGNQ